MVREQHCCQHDPFHLSLNQGAENGRDLSEKHNSIFRESGMGIGNRNIRRPLRSDLKIMYINTERFITN